MILDMYLLKDKNHENYLPRFATISLLNNDQPWYPTILWYVKHTDMYTRYLNPREPTYLPIFNDTEW